MRTAPLISGACLIAGWLAWIAAQILNILFVAGPSGNGDTYSRIVTSAGKPAWLWTNTILLIAGVLLVIGSIGLAQAMPNRGALLFLVACLSAVGGIGIACWGSLHIFYAAMSRSGASPDQLRLVVAAIEDRAWAPIVGTGLVALGLASVSVVPALKRAGLASLWLMLLLLAGIPFAAVDSVIFRRNDGPLFILIGVGLVWIFTGAVLIRSALSKADQIDR